MPIFRPRKFAFFPFLILFKRIESIDMTPCVISFLVHTYLLSADFFFRKIFQEYHLSVKQFGYRSGPKFCQENRHTGSESKLCAKITEDNTSRQRVNILFWEKCAIHKWTSANKNKQTKAPKTF